jgi:hypothetical protein
MAKTLVSVEVSSPTLEGGDISKAVVSEMSPLRTSAMTPQKTQTVNQE